MIERIETIIDEIKDSLYHGDITKTVLIKKIRKIKLMISKYFQSHSFNVKDMKTREQISKVIRDSIHMINNVESELIKMEFFEKDKVLDLIMELEENLLDALLEVQVVGEARPLIVTIEKEINKKLEKEIIKIPKDIEKYDPTTIKLYKVFKVFPREYTISELSKILKVDEEEINKSVEILKSEGYLDILYKGDEKVIVWTQ